MSTNENFCKYFLKCSPAEVIGLAHLFGIQVATPDGPREAADIICDILDAYEALNRRQRRNLVRLLKQTINDNDVTPSDFTGDAVEEYAELLKQQEVTPDGTLAEDSEE